MNNKVSVIIQFQFVPKFLKPWNEWYFKDNGSRVMAIFMKKEHFAKLDKDCIYTAIATCYLTTKAIWVLKLTTEPLKDLPKTTLIKWLDVNFEKDE